MTTFVSIVINPVPPLFGLPTVVTITSARPSWVCRSVTLRVEVGVPAAFTWMVAPMSRLAEDAAAAMRISVSNWSTTEADIDHSAAAILRAVEAERASGE